MADVHKKTDGGPPLESGPKRLFAVVKELAWELHPGRRDRLQITAASRLDRDLAIDSLGRAELLRRMERTFDVRLPDRLLGTAETVGDLLAGLAHEGAQGVGERELEAVLSPAAGLAATPGDAETLIEVLEAHEAERTHILITDAIPEGSRDHLRGVVVRGAASGRRTGRARRQAGRPCGDDAAHGHGLLRGIHRDVVCRRGAGSGLSAGADVTA